MSTRDARLSPKERAALANLEAAAAADDPQFAARLRGSPLFRIKTAAPRFVALMVGQWRALLRHGWWGLPITAAGLVLMVLGLVEGLWMAAGGAVLATVGLRLAVHAVEQRWRRRRSESSSNPPG